MAHHVHPIKNWINTKTYGLYDAFPPDDLSYGPEAHFIHVFRFLDASEVLWMDSLWETYTYQKSILL